MDPSLATGAHVLPEGFLGDATSLVMSVPDVAAPPMDSLPQASVCFATSGSTGDPSWVVIPKSALLASAEAVNRHLDVTRNSRWGLALPLHHVGGFCVPVRAHVAGCEVRVFSGKWDARAFADWLADHAVTHTSLVPTQVHDLVAAGASAPSSLVAVVVGGGRLEPSLAGHARALGWPVFASYGMTETCSQVATQGSDSLTETDPPDALPPLDIWQIEADPVGCLRVAGPALCSGWMKQCDDGLWKYHPREGDWLTTRDMVEITPQGRIRILGRADDLVKVLGELVSPARIESELTEIDPQLAPGSFAITAVPDARMEHRLVPVFADDVDRAIVEAAIAAYHANCPGYQRLSPPVFIPEIPRSPLGKVLRARLAAMLVDVRA